MKRILIIIVSIIISLVLTLILADSLSLYHFKDIPTPITLIYLLFIFCLITYILLSLIYIINKKRKKEKIDIKKIISLILFFVVLLLILGFIISLNIDWMMYHQEYINIPFYKYIIRRSLEFLLPSIILIIVIMLLLKNKR